jgi:hypothetical protein
VIGTFSAGVHSGSLAARVTNRTAAWQGIGSSVLGIMQSGETYFISAWLKLQNGSQEPIGLTLQQTDGSGTSYHPIQWSVGSQDQWVLLSGSYTLNVTGTLTQLRLYVEGPAAGVDLLADSLSHLGLGQAGRCRWGGHRAHHSACGRSRVELEADPVEAGRPLGMD